MTKLYDAEILTLALEELLKSPWATGDGEPISNIQYHYGVNDALKLVCDMIAGNVPDELKLITADATPKAPGKWLKNGGYYYCSVCGSRHTNTERINSKYCRYCGARMGAG